MSNDKRLDKTEDKSKSLTIFDSIKQSEVASAIRNLIDGKTPKQEIRRRKVGGGKEADYVNAYYMFRQISLITGFRWASECLEERLHPANPPHQEVAAKMRVTIWDKQGNEFSHDSWGCVQIQKQGVLLYDQMKAAYSDGIKKCLSYFGIANDVYGGKDLQFFGEEPPETEVIEIDDSPVPGDRLQFLKYCADNKLSVDKAAKLVGADDIDSITDFDTALKKLKELTS